MSERIADQLAEAGREGFEQGRKTAHRELLDRLVSPEVVEAVAEGIGDDEGAIALQALSAARAFLLK